jgi:hypothetical protein
MPHDIATDIYRYLAHDWGLQGEALTDTKCAQLTAEIPVLRKGYWGEREISYRRPLTRRAYLAAFGPRYAYVLSKTLNRKKAECIDVLRPWHKAEAVMCLLGGGPACELFGLLDWLYENGIEPRFLRVIIMDREGYWRTFHNFLFGDLISKHFRKTLVVPSYESVTFPVVTGNRFDRTVVNYNFGQIAHIAEARLISVVNCLSELQDYRGIACHLRFMARIAWNPQVLVCADSAARKRRPRMKWFQESFGGPPTVNETLLKVGILKMKFSQLDMDPTTTAIFKTAGAPRWENKLKRWYCIKKIG